MWRFRGVQPLREPTPAFRHRVLVVDDEQDIRDLVVMWLRDDPRCLAVMQAADLEGALELTNTGRPDVVLLDYFLGHQVCTEILPQMRAAAPAATIVVFTASRRAADAAGVLTLGADHLVEKGGLSIDDVVELLVGDRLPVRRP